MPDRTRPSLTAFKSVPLGLLVVLTVAMMSPVSAGASVGGGRILKPGSGRVVPMGTIRITVRVAPSLVGQRAGIMTIPGWTLRLSGQPRNPGNYNLFTI